MVHKIAITISFAALFIVGSLFYFLYNISGSPATAVAEAGMADNIFGYAWSSNIGWISFNDANIGSGGGFYGVNADASGNLSGYAWSSNIGWISFNHSAGCPGAAGNPVCQPKIDPASREISGFARACAGTVPGDCGGASRSDGWDGWISLRGASPNYGITTSTALPFYWSGWAWGSEVVGWISFSGTLPDGSIYGVCGPAVGSCAGPGLPPFTVAANASPNPAEVEKPVTWSALISGGTPPYSYDWSGTDGLSGVGASIQKIYKTVGLKTGTVTVADSSVPKKIMSASFDLTVVPKKKIGGIKEIQPE